MSEPYAKTPPAPKDFTLDKALQHTVSTDGHYHCGKLDFQNRADYLSFETAQRAIGGKPEQLAILHAVETTGKIPRQEATAPAPAGTTVEGMLDLKGQKADAQGFYHLGNMQVKQTEYERFADLQREACKDPEGLAQLYHMQNSSGKPLTYRVHHGEDRNDRYEPGSNTIHVDDTTAVRDAFNGTTVPVVTAAMHEQGHMLGREGISTLQGIPAGNYENMEEQRVIEGPEARDMALRHHPARHSHYGSVVNVHGLDSRKPALTVEENGREKIESAPLKLTGTVGESKDGWTKFNVPADGKTPAHEIKLKTEELSLAMGGTQAQAKPVLADAHKHNDTATVELTADGRMLYQNTAQQTRLHAHPVPGVEYPAAMTAVRDTARVPAAAGMDR